MIELPPGKHSIHGTTIEEQRRLRLLNNLLNDSSLCELALRGGVSILDLGTGLGHYARAMKHAAGPGGRVVAIERDRGQLERALGDAEEAGEGSLVDNFVGLFTGATGYLTNSGLLDRPTIDAGLRAFDEWRTHPDAVLWYSFNWAEGVVRPDGSTELTDV